jgi:hypothetical protein
MLLTIFLVPNCWRIFHPAMSGFDFGLAGFVPIGAVGKMPAAQCAQSNYRPNDCGKYFKLDKFFPLKNEQHTKLAKTNKIIGPNSLNSIFLQISTNLKEGFKPDKCQPTIWLYPVEYPSEWSKGQGQCKLRRNGRMNIDVGIV